MEADSDGNHSGDLKGLPLSLRGIIELRGWGRGGRGRALALSPFSLVSSLSRPSEGSEGASRAALTGVRTEGRASTLKGRFTISRSKPPTRRP